MTNLDSILKSRDITLLTKVHLVKGIVFPVVMYGCENCTIKKDEHWRIYAFELWCWRRLLGAPWRTRRSNQTILKEIKPKYSLEGLILKLKLQYLDHLMQRTDSLEKTLILGKIAGKRRRGQQLNAWMASLTQCTWVWANSRRQWRTWKPSVLQFTGLQRDGHNLALNNSTQNSTYKKKNNLLQIIFRDYICLIINLGFQKFGAGRYSYSELLGSQSDLYVS